MGVGEQVKKLKRTAELLFVFILAFSVWGCSGRAVAAAKMTVESASAPISESALKSTSETTAAKTKSYGPGEALGMEPGKQEETSSATEDTQVRIHITANGNTVVYELNGSQAAKDLYAQLPLTLEVENFSTNEKICYPPEKLDPSDAPMAENGKGTLAYYAPWGDVVMFYGDFDKNSGLYELGRAVSGADQIGALSGTVEITAAD